LPKKYPKYPRPIDVKEHKDKLWQMLLLYFSGVVTVRDVENALRCLMGDAALWTNDNHKELNLEQIKILIGLTRLSATSRVMPKTIDGKLNSFLETI
jgi:hypothetical protein